MKGVPLLAKDMEVGETYVHIESDGGILTFTIKGIQHFKANMRVNAEWQYSNGEQHWEGIKETGFFRHNDKVELLAQISKSS